MPGAAGQTGLSKHGLGLPTAPDKLSRLAKGEDPSVFAAALVRGALGKG